MFIGKIAKLIEKGVKTKTGKRIVGLVLGGAAGSSQLGQGLPGLSDGMIPIPQTWEEAVLGLMYILGAMILIEMRSPSDEQIVNDVRDAAAADIRADQRAKARAITENDKRENTRKERY